MWQRSVYIKWHETCLNAVEFHHKFLIIRSGCSRPRLTGILLSCCRASTIVPLHFLDSKKRLEEKASWKQHKDAMCCFEQIQKSHPSKDQLYGHLFPISQIIPVRQAQHAWHCWKSKDKIICGILLWTLTHPPMDSYTVLADQ